MTKPMIIDVDLLIEIYNKKNPKLKPLDREQLAKELEMNKQIFTDWKGGKTPKLVGRLFQMAEIGKCRIDDFVKTE